MGVRVIVRIMPGLLFSGEFESQKIASVANEYHGSWSSNEPFSSRERVNFICRSVSETVILFIHTHASALSIQCQCSCNLPKCHIYMLKPHPSNQPVQKRAAAIPISRVSSWLPGLIHLQISTGPTSAENFILPMFRTSRSKPLQSNGIRAMFTSKPPSKTSPPYSLPELLSRLLLLAFPPRAPLREITHSALKRLLNVHAPGFSFALPPRQLIIHVALQLHFVVHERPAAHVRSIGLGAEAGVQDR